MSNIKEFALWCEIIDEGFTKKVGVSLQDALSVELKTLLQDYIDGYSPRRMVDLFVEMYNDSSSGRPQKPDRALEGSNQ